MASILKKEIQERSNKKYSQGSHTNTKASYLKNDAEFKKLFGLTKDLRVCLTRIPDHLDSGKAFNSFNSLVKSSSYKDADFVVKGEDKIQSFSKKRKAKTTKKMDYTKRRKIKSAGDTVMSWMELLLLVPHSSVVVYQRQTHPNITLSRAIVKTRELTEAEHCSHDKQE